MQITLSTERYIPTGKPIPLGTHRRLSKWELTVSFLGGCFNRRSNFLEVCLLPPKDENEEPVKGIFISLSTEKPRVFMKRTYYGMFISYPEK